MRNCNLCGKPIQLSPTATQRVERYGGRPADYEACFPNHASCELEKREAETSALMRRHRERSAQLSAKGFYPFTHP